MKTSAPSDDAQAAFTSNPAFCVLPWLHVSASIDGVIGRCCLDKTLYHDEHYQSSTPSSLSLSADTLGCLSSSPLARDSPRQIATLREAFDSEAMRQTRAAMLQGKRISACSACYEREALGALSYRHNMNDTFREAINWEEALAQTSPDGRFPGDLIFLDLRLGNACNLHCSMCSYPTSSAWKRHVPQAWAPAVIDPYSQNDAFWREMREITPKLRRIYFAGGEPLIQPSHDRMLRLLLEHGSPGQMTLIYNSNLGILPKGIEAAWQPFGAVRLGASCDGGGELYEPIRRGGKWHRFVENLRRVKNHAEITLAVALQQGNVSGLSALLDFAVAEGLPVDLTNLVQYPRSMSLETLPAGELARHRDDVANLALQHHARGHGELACQLEALQTIIGQMAKAAARRRA